MLKFLSNKQFVFIFLSLIMISKVSVGQYEIIAHRGASYIAPENTVASAKLAWELNADAVEVDVYLSKDNKVVVLHDKNTKRTAANNEKYSVAETNSSELRKLDVGSWKSKKYKGEKIPFLSEIIETIPKDKKLVVEIKCGEEIIPHLLDIFNKSEKLDQIVFISFGWETIIAIKEAFPKNKCYWLSSNIIDVKSKLPLVSKHNLDGINLSHKIITQSLVQKSKNLGLEVLSWTIDDPDKAKKLISFGVTGITTNRPGWLRKEIE